MDIALLASAVTEFLAPVLPQLRSMGERLGSDALNHVEGTISETALSVWKRLRTKLDSKDKTQAATREVAGRPEDSESREKLRNQIQDIFAQDPLLAAEIARLIPNTSTINTVQQKAGDGAIQFGQVAGNVNLGR